MLVLTRRVGEKVMVGDELEVVVLEMGGGQVKLGFLGPRGIRIYRAEVLERMRAGVPRRKRSEPDVDDDGGATSDAA